MTVKHGKLRLVVIRFFLGTSSRNKIATFDVQVAGSPLEKASIPVWYRQPNGQPTVGDFESLSG